MILQELFNTNNTNELKIKDGDSKWEATTTLKNGKEFKFIAERSSIWGTDSGYSIRFMVDNSYNMTDDANNLEVMSLVKRCMGEFLDAHKPYVITMSADRASRVKTYNAMLKRYLKGWVGMTNHLGLELGGGGSITFYYDFNKPDDGYNPKVPKIEYDVNISEYNEMRITVSRPSNFKFSMVINGNSSSTRIQLPANHKIIFDNREDFPFNEVKKFIKGSNIEFLTVTKEKDEHKDFIDFLNANKVKVTSKEATNYRFFDVKDVGGLTGGIEIKTNKEYIKSDITNFELVVVGDSAVLDSDPETLDRIMNALFVYKELRLILLKQTKVIDISTPFNLIGVSVDDAVDFFNKLGMDVKTA